MPDNSSNETFTPNLIKVLKGEVVSPPPIWLMRQAGRYLPEYREVRAKAAGFLDLCYRPDMAAEVTLQPIRRFGFDAAILFADILVVPDALGQKVEFEEGHGPRLEAGTPEELLTRLNPAKANDKLCSIYETVTRIREALPRETALIGFCGAPWTVATYMIAGRGTPDQAPTRLAAYRDPDNFARLIDLLADVSVEYLSGQIAAGAQTVQIFDSWAGVLADTEFQRWVIEPTAKMVARLKERYPEVPVIGFPRGAGMLTERFLQETGVDGVGCDTSVPLTAMRETISSHAAVQGNLDPLLLVAGGHLLESRIREIMAALEGKRHIFNLGHGILPQTPIEHVEKLVKLVQS
ncbi:MAG: uroporphyrinogen decarboxylase [Alphaproteobacteria bacterium]